MRASCWGEQSSRRQSCSVVGGMAEGSSTALAPVVATWDGDADDTTQMQIDALLAAESDINARLREGRSLEAADSSGKPPDQLLADARRKRDQARRDVQRAQSRLSQLLKERQASTKRLDKLQRAASQRVVNPEQLTLPSVALRSGGDDAIAEEIKALMRENKELEEAIARNDGARIHLEKLQNEKRDTVRQVKELKGELKMVQQQLEIKRAELEELEALVKPSPVRQAFQAEVDRLRREINASSSAKTHAEREASALAKRLLRVRTVLGPFLKSEGIKPQQALPAADDELAGRLADYVLALAEKVRTLEATLGQREERAAALETSAESAANELKKLVAKRTQATTRKTGAAGLLTSDAGQPAALVAALAAAAGPADASEVPVPAVEGEDGAPPARVRARKPKKALKARNVKGDDAPPDPLSAAPADEG